MSAELYAESSAVLSWLLGQPGAEAIRRKLADAELVVTSELTLIECHRVIHRAVAVGELDEPVAADRRAQLARASQHWTLFGLEREVTERAQRPFSAEPIRTLDAIHLSTVLLARSLVPGVRLLALDRRIRAAAEALGLDPLPRSTELETES